MSGQRDTFLPFVSSLSAWFCSYVFGVGSNITSVQIRDMLRMLYAIRICVSVCVLVWLPLLTCQQRAATMVGTRVEGRVKGVPAVSTASNAPPTCCWKVVVPVHVLESKAQEAKVLSLCRREGGRGTG